MLTKNIILKELNKIFPSNKWVVTKNTLSTKENCIWIKYKDKHNHSYTFGFVRTTISKERFNEIIKAKILRDLALNDLIRIICSLKPLY